MREQSAPAARWLLLVHQLPAHPSNLRVHIWRRLQHAGAVSLRNSIYVLPNSPDSREDFEWIRTEIADRGGQVSLLVADAVDGCTDDELEEDFRNAIAPQFAALAADVEGLMAAASGKPEQRRRLTLRRDAARLRERFVALKSTDFFGCPGAASTQAALERLERLVEDPQPEATPAGSRLDPRFYRRRVWLTRPRPGIDRMGSAWLIRRFIAPDAKFAFGSSPTREQIPFDMADVEFGHHGNECTYETLVRRFGITDPVAIRVGHLVHDLDLKENRYGLIDTATFGRLVEGLRNSSPDDSRLLEDGMRLVEALYQSLARQDAPNTQVRPRTVRRAGVTRRGSHRGKGVS